jgi:hypothetical protein
MRARRDPKKGPATAADSSAGRSGSRPKAFSSPAPSSVELLDEALQIERLAPCREFQESLSDTLPHLLARWMLARSETPEMDTIRCLCKARAIVTNGFEG